MRFEELRWRDSVLDCAALRRFSRPSKAPEDGAVQNLAVFPYPIFFNADFSHRAYFCANLS
jgi:hypothetical protein